MYPRSRSGAVGPGRDARSSEMKPSGVLAGNNFAVWVEQSGVDPSGRVNFHANPRHAGRFVRWRRIAGAAGEPDQRGYRRAAEMRGTGERGSLGGGGEGAAVELPLGVQGPTAGLRPAG